MDNKVEIIAAPQGEALRITVRGELDMDSSPQLLDAIRNGLKGGTGLEINLHGVSYIDSSGIAVLVQGFKQARRQSVGYVISDPSRQVMAVMTLSQLHEFFAFRFSDEKE